MRAGATPVPCVFVWVCECESLFCGESVLGLVLDRTMSKVGATWPPCVYPSVIGWGATGRSPTGRGEQIPTGKDNLVVMGKASPCDQTLWMEVGLTQPKTQPNLLPRTLRGKAWVVWRISTRRYQQLTPVLQHLGL